VRIGVAVIALALAARAEAQAFPARSGETGILDVPDAESSGPGGGQLAAELRLDHRPGVPDDVGALPLYAVGGFSERLDIGFTVRESGQAGDPRPARILFGAAAKLRLWAPGGPVPGAALSFVADRVNERAIAGGRLALSTTRSGPFRMAAFVGAEAEASGLKNGGVTAGVAASIALARGLDLAAEALTGPRGENFGAALRFQASPTLGVALGGNYFPQEEGFRFAVTFAAAPPPRRSSPQTAATPAAAPNEVAVGAPRFLDDRPRFRLRIPYSGALALAAGARRVQHGPPTSRGAVASAPAAQPDGGAAPTKSAAPTLEDLAEAQLREQEPLAAAREARVRTAAEQLDERERETFAERKRLEDREGKLEEREQQLALREQRMPRAAPTLQQRQLESVETQLAFQERQLFAQERSFLPSIEMAEGRERAATAREQAEAAEAARLAAAAKAATTRGEELDLRKQALSAKNRQLAGLEGRLIAKGERIDALERQLRDRRERLDAWQRRLDTRTQRLDLREQVESKSPPAAAPQKPAETTAAPKDKPAFVMVVKSPTAIQKTGDAAAPAGDADSATHPGIAVEKSVVAATVVMFPSSTAPMSELDRETVDNLAKLAAKQRLELLVWARAKDPATLPEAQRRADELRQRVVTAGPLDPKQVVIRVTTRPGAQRVDVVLSALREVAKPVGAAPAPTRAAPTLQGGESGKRQIRDAVVAAQPSIEACVGEHLASRRAQRAEGVLKVQVSAQGRVTKVVTGGDALAGDELEVCLAGASATWQFPTGETDYAVDVPITVMPGGSSK
jgi:hypothetical protein